jgi:hypothetical protein
MSPTTADKTSTPVKTSKSDVKTPAQVKIEADAATRAADKEAADAQVAEDTAVLNDAKAKAKQANDDRLAAEADAEKAIDAAADAPDDAAKSLAAVTAHNQAIAANQAKASADQAVALARERLAISTAKAEKLAPVSSNSPWHYCLTPGHAPELKHHTRFFQSDDTGCPVCPVCKRQVSAVPADMFGAYPVGILAVAERLAQ